MRSSAVHNVSYDDLCNLTLQRDLFCFVLFYLFTFLNSFFIPVWMNKDITASTWDTENDVAWILLKWWSGLGPGLIHFSDSSALKLASFIKRLRITSNPRSEWNDRRKTTTVQKRKRRSTVGRDSQRHITHLQKPFYVFVMRSLITQWENECSGGRWMQTEGSVNNSLGFSGHKLFKIGIDTKLSFSLASSSRYSMRISISFSHRTRIAHYRWTHQAGKLI